MNVKDKVVSIVNSVCSSLQLDELQHETDFGEMGIDSLDQFNILLEIEEYYKIKISDEDVNKLKTVNNIIKYLERIINA